MGARVLMLVDSGGSVVICACDTAKVVVQQGLAAKAAGGFTSSMCRATLQEAVQGRHS